MNLSTIDFKNTKNAFKFHSDKDLSRMKWLFRIMGVSELAKIGTFFLKYTISWVFPIKKIVKYTIFKQFVGGESLKDCQDVVSQYGNLTFIPDFAAEDVLSDAEIMQNMLQIEEIILQTASNPHYAFAVFKFSAICSIAELIHFSSNDCFEEESYKSLRQRVDWLCAIAKEKKVKIMIDAEDYAFQDIIDNIVLEMMEKYNQGNVTVFHTLQMYRIDAFERLTGWQEMSLSKNFQIGVKLVRGAYMDKERSRAAKMGYNDPIWATKELTDAAYNKAMFYCLLNNIPICIATHNQESIEQACANYGIDELNMSFAQLYGMGDVLTFNLLEAGYLVSKYLPFGPIEKTIPYLLRRAEENKSVAGQMGREYQFVLTEIQRRKKNNL